MLIFILEIILEICWDIASGVHFKSDVFQRDQEVVQKEIEIGTKNLKEYLTLHETNVSCICYI